MYEKMGAHLITHNGQPAPSSACGRPTPARSRSSAVSTVGSKTHQLRPRGSSGIWEGFIPGVRKAHCTSTTSNPGSTATASIKPIRSACCMRSRRAPPPSSGTSTTNGPTATGCRSAPAAIRSARLMSIYEVHLGSWMRVPEEHNRPLTYREMRLVSPNTLVNSASLTSSSCPSWSILSSAPGDTRPPATSRPPRATAHRRTSCTWSTTCTSTASA